MSLRTCLCGLPSDDAVATRTIGWVLLQDLQNPEQMYRALGCKMVVGMPFKDQATSDTLYMPQIPPSSDKTGRRALKRLQVPLLKERQPPLFCCLLDCFSVPHCCLSSCFLCLLLPLTISAFSASWLAACS